MELWMWLVVGWLGGTVIGYALSWLIVRWHDKKLCVGTLRVDRSDPDEAPYLFLELEQDGMTKIHQNKTVLFKVDLNSYLTRN